MKILSFLAAAAAADDNKIESIEDSIGYFQELTIQTVEWFQREQRHLISMAIGLAVTAVIVLVVHWIMRRILLPSARKLPGELPARIVDRLTAPLRFLVLITGLSACNNMVHFPGSLDHWLAKFFYAAFILAFLWGIFRIIGLFDFHFRERAERSGYQMNTLLVDLVSRSVKVAVWILALIFIAENLFSLNVTALVTGAGVAGLAIAFAAQNTVANLFGAMSIITDRTFKVGDRVMIGDASGSVEAVGFRSTRLRSLDGTVWNIPNRIAADGTIENITSRPFLKHAFTLGLVYSTTPEQMRLALKILREILDNHPGFDMEKFPPRFYFSDFRDFSLDISVTLWFQTLDYFQFMEWREEINLAILEKFNAAGLEFAFPTSTNYLIKQGADK